MKNLFNSFLLAMTAVFALTSGAQAQSTKISGTLAGYAGSKVYFETFNAGQPVRLDSATINKKGKFEMEVTAARIDFHRLSVSQQSFILLIPHPGESISITANGKPLQKSYKIKGSPDSEAVAEFVIQEQNIIAERDSISKLFNEATQSGNQEQLASLQTSFQENNLQYRELVLSTIDKNSTSIASLVALGKLKINSDFDAFEKVQKGLAENWPESEYAKQLTTMVTQAKAQRDAEAAANAATAIGSVAKEIKLESPDGKEIALSDLRGKVVLIDFWASWCRPCRAENPNVVKLYKKYKEAGFEVYSVSLDKDKSRWVAAIEKDGLIWNSHVSDLKGWQCEPAGEYGVKGIPFTVLIDQEGKIIGRKLRGPQLEAKLAELFGF